jgi:hypothetical protein
MAEDEMESSERLHDLSEIDLLAHLIWAEARGETTQGESVFLALPPGTT